MAGATMARAAAGQGRRDPALLAEAGPSGRPLGRPERPHICFVAPFAWPVFSRDSAIKLVGGAEVQQSILMRLFQRNGYRVSLVTLDFGQPQRVVVDGVTVYKTYRMDEGIPVLRFVHPRLTSVWQALRDADADIYYQRSADLLTAVTGEYCRRHGRRSIYAAASDRDFERGQQQIRFARDRWLYERGLAQVDRIVVQNLRQLESLRVNYRRDATLIPSCYELPAEARPGRGDAVLWVGTVHDYKRPEMLLELARRLPKRRFIMIGGSAAPGERLRPGYYEAIRDAAASLPNVEFKGFMPLEEVERWYDRGRMLVNTSVYEGMPNTFLQAWARGIPTVATVDVGASVDGSALYRKFSNLEEAEAEIERLFNDQAYWGRASARALRYFESEHSSAEVLRRYAGVFEELLA